MIPRLFDSVGSRLLALVAAEVVSACLLLGLGVHGVARVMEALDYTYRFVVPPLEGLAEALHDAGQLGASPGRTDPALDARVERVRDFLERYREEWLLEGNQEADAVRAEAYLQRTGKGHLIVRERRALERAVVAVQALEASRAAGLDGDDPERAAASLTGALEELVAVHADFVRLAGGRTAERSLRTQRVLLVAGAAGIMAAALLGLFVRAGIAPRLRRLTRSVRHFRERGEHEPVQDEGRDEVAVLANALDAGLASIVARDDERRRFLAVAAHELRTPLTSIRGFTEAALRHPERAALRERALQVVQQQSLRLSRLVEELFLLTRVERGDVRFQPAPLDLSALARRVGAEVSAGRTRDGLLVEAPEEVHVLGDARLLEQGLWSLFSHAAALSADGAPLRVVVEDGAAHARVTVHLRPAVACAHDDVAQLTSPLAGLQYEGPGRVHVGLGLHLCREVARVHGGALRVSRSEAGDLVLSLEVPA